MNKWIMLGIAAVLAISGCGAKESPKPLQGVQSPAPEKASGTAAANGTDASVTVNAGSAPGGAKSSDVSVQAKALEPGESVIPPPQQDPQAAKAESVKPPNASTASGQADLTPATGAPQPVVPAEQPPQTSSAAPVPKADVLTISIVGDKGHGVILKETTVPYQEGITVLDVLKQATKANKVQMEFQGKGAYAYVQGIDNLYEFDGGPKSGWVYKVNGGAPSRGAGAYKLAAGDRIEWLYTLNLGEDVGAKVP